MIKSSSFHHPYHDTLLWNIYISRLNETHCLKKSLKELSSLRYPSYGLGHYNQLTQKCESWIDSVFNLSYTSKKLILSNNNSSLLLLDERDSFQIVFIVQQILRQELQNEDLDSKSSNLVDLESIFDTFEKEIHSLNSKSINNHFIPCF